MLKFKLKHTFLISCMALCKLDVDRRKHFPLFYFSVWHALTLLNYLDILSNLGKELNLFVFAVIWLTQICDVSNPLRLLFHFACFLSNQVELTWFFIVVFFSLLHQMHFGWKAIVMLGVAQSFFSSFPCTVQLSSGSLEWNESPCTQPLSSDITLRKWFVKWVWIAERAWGEVPVLA